MVMRTYTTGISLSHIPLSERGNMKKKLAAIVNQLSDENTRLNVNGIRETINYLMFTKLKDLRICDELNLKDVGSGKYAVNALMTEFSNSANHLHSGYNQLLITAKGYLDRVSKVQQFLKFMSDNPGEFVKWILWGRSVYANRCMSKSWKVSFFYVDRLMAGVHNRYFKDTLPCYVAEINQDDFKQVLDEFIVSFNADTEHNKQFLNRLKRIQKMDLDLSFIPLGWNNLKIWMKANNYARIYLSCFTEILSQVYLKHYLGMINNINKIQTAKIEELLTIPFVNDREHRLPYLMVSGPKYVVRRSNNNQSWISMQKQGYFELNFKFLEDRWDKSINVRVRASRKMRELFNRDVKLKSMIVMPAVNGNVNIHLIFSGKIGEFIATKHLKNKLRVKKSEIIGIDINRRGEYAVVSSLDEKIPDDINSINEKWDIVFDEIGKYQRLLETNKNDWKKKLYSKHIDNLYRRKKNLRQSYHLKLANWIGQQIYHSDAKHLVIEDLNVNTFGSKGALAKAIESMADDTSLYAREVLAVNLMGRQCELHLVNPYHSSTKHANCGGNLKRSRDHYDIASCGKCNIMVNTHLNAAINLASSTIRSRS
ncbi:MAG: hypothetical protein OEY10_03800 [Nitrosopumilus sp.]|nr:hypothetical protein [Nitrosopumilus sp.]